ncbi:MAG: amidase [Bacteroidia bacterium]
MKLLLLFSIILLFTYLSCQTNSSEVPPKAADFPFEEITIRQLQDGYQAGKYTVQEVAQAYLDRIAAVDPKLHSVIMTNPDALSIAAALDEELKAGKARGPMHGVPVLLKDNIDTHDKMPCTAGSRALANSFPLQDSWVAARLREAGAVILGKANLSEWANFRGEMSSSGWSAIGGQCNNPYDLTRNPCGSSSGSGVAVSANLCVVAIGTETNGSIVCPSTTNGIVGIKPTVGLVSRSGVIPISYSQDTPGPMARTLEDAAICLSVLTGIDSVDGKTPASEGHIEEDYSTFLKADGLKGKRIGWWKTPSENHFKVDAEMKKAIDFMKSQGAEIVELESVMGPGANSSSFQVMLYEYKDGLNTYFASLGEKSPIKSLEDVIVFNKQDSIELEFYDQRYLEMAQEKGPITDYDYESALVAMHGATRREGIDKVMNEHQLDAIVGPTGSPAWKTDHTNGDHYMLSSSSPAAISGYPNITVPMGFVEGLPVGISFFGRAWSEPVLIEIAGAFEQGTKARRAPGLN